MMIRFDLGKVVATPGAMAAMDAHNVSPVDILSRHRNGDWGDIHAEDRGLNEQALETGARLFSVYNLPGKNGEVVTIWVITEAEYEGRREATTILLPEDY